MKPSDEELAIESHWILDRLCNYSTVVTQGPNQGGEPETTFKYQRLLRQTDAVHKIVKILAMLRQKLIDVPTIAKYRKFEYIDQLDEEAVWIIYNLDQEYGKF